MRFVFPFLNDSKNVCVLAGLGAIALLAGCATSPQNQSSSVDVDAPLAWQSEAITGEVDTNSWLADLSDMTLDSLIKEALENNYDLKASAAALEQARGAAIQAGIGVYPQVTLNPSGSRTYNGTSDTHSDSFGLRARVSWELDLWGRVRNERQAGIADWEASVEDYRAARLSLAASTASLWYDSVEAQLLLNLAKQTLDAFERNLEVVEDNFRRGVAEALDVRLIRANVASARSSYEQRLRSRDARVRSIEILLGRYPSNELGIATELPEIKEEVPAGLPSEILWRRPDLASAERDLAADLMRKKMAFKSNLPTFSLTGSAGTSSSEFSDLLDEQFKVWNLALDLTQPLFPTSRLKGGVVRARGVYEASLARYADAILVAFKEVEDALNEQSSYKRDYEAQRIAQEESIAATELAWSNYKRGLSDITTVLDAERRSLSSQSSFIEVANERIQSRIDLYLALGGGFEFPSE
ncbi:efflux transporter outer membrane subunit [Puniceicoccaceae bacterium K14]|nr:efflux transporter outer membrane subunit [Puniceicoccaceae bacterium K14]